MYHGLRRLRRGATVCVERGEVQVDRANHSICLQGRANSMFKEHGNTSGLKHLSEDRAILDIIVVLLQDRPSRATDGFFPAPVDMHQATARHATQPSAGLDHNDPGAFLRRGARGHYPTRITTIDTDVISHAGLRRREPCGQGTEHEAGGLPKEGPTGLGSEGHRCWLLA